MERTLGAVAVYAPASVPAAESACVSIITRTGALQTPACGEQPETGTSRLHDVLDVKLRAVAEHVVRTGQDPQTPRRPDFPPGG